MSQAAMDANAFAELKELMGDSFSDIIKMSLQSLPQQLKEIKSAIENQKVDNLFNTSHKMKSSCGSIGAFGLAEKVEAIEIISRDGSTEISDQMFSDLQLATQQVLSILKNELEWNGSWDGLYPILYLGENKVLAYTSMLPKIHKIKSDFHTTAQAIWLLSLLLEESGSY